MSNLPMIAALIVPGCVVALAAGSIVRSRELPDLRPPEQSRVRSLSDEPLAADCVEISGFMIVHKPGQGWLVQFMKHVTKLPLVATTAREALTIGFSQRAD